MNAFWHERFVSVDVETTGLDRQVDVVTEIALVSVERARVTDVYAAQIEGAPSAQGVAARLARTETQRPEVRASQQVWRDVAARLSAADFVVAYNAAFDFSFISVAMSRAGEQLWTAPMFDPWLFEANEDNTRSNRLVNACTRRNVPHPHPHQAESDAQACATLFLRQAETGAWGAGDIASARRLQCAWRDELSAQRQRR